MELAVDVPSDVRFALNDIDIDFVIESCQKLDYRILYNHKFSENLQMFSSNFVVHNDGYYPFSLVKLFNTNAKQEIMLRSTANSKPCCYLLSCIALFDSSLASHILLLYSQLNNADLYARIKNIPIQDFVVPSNTDSYPYLNAMTTFITTKYDIQLLYEIPTILQSYLFTFQFKRLIDANISTHSLLNNKLYLDEPCRRFIYDLIKERPFENNIHWLCRGFNDGERDDEDPFFMEQILQLYNYDQLAIAYRYLLNDYTHKLKRISYINQLESHLLQHLDLSEHYHLLDILSIRRPLECCSILLRLLDKESVSLGCITAVFKMLDTLWFDCNEVIQRDIFTQFILPMLHKSKNAPELTVYCLEYTGRMAHVEVFQDLIQSIALTLIPPLKLKIEHVNKYYNELVGYKALKCLVPFGFTKLDSIFIKSDLKTLTATNADLEAFLSVFVEQEVRALHRTEYDQEQLRIESVIDDEAQLSIDWNDGALETFLVYSQYPNHTYALDGTFNTSEVVKFSAELLEFSRFIKFASSSFFPQIVKRLREITLSLSQTVPPSVCIAIGGCIHSISTNKQFNLFESSFLECLIELVPKLPDMPIYTHLRAFYISANHTSTMIMHYVEVMNDLLKIKTSEIKLPNVDDNSTVMNQKHILWHAGLFNAHLDRIKECTASTLSNLKSVVEYTQRHQISKKLYNTTSYYKPQSTSLIAHAINHGLLGCFVMNEILPILPFKGKLPIQLLRNQAPFNLELSSYYINHFIDYLDYGLLLNLFGIWDLEFFNKIEQRGKKLLFKGLQPTDILLLDHISHNLNWIDFITAAKDRKCLNEDALTYIGQYLFNHFTMIQIEDLAFYDTTGLAYLFKDCTSTSISGDFIKFKIGQQTQQNASIVIAQHIPRLLLLGMASVLRKQDLIDLLLFHKKSFDEFKWILSYYERKDGKNRDGLTQQALVSLDTDRLKCIMAKYSESIELLKTAYFQPNSHIEVVLVAHLQDQMEQEEE